MTSAIDATKPADATAASKADLRANLAAAKSEIEALQAQVGALSPYVFKGMRNRLINGTLVFDSRNGGVAVSVAAGTTKFGPDRWYGTSIAGGGVFSIQVLTTGTLPTGFGQFVRIAVTTAKGALVASDAHAFCQAVEGYHWRDMAYGTANAVSAVLSFWVRSSIAGTYSVSLNNSALVNSYATTYSVSIANTWEYKSIVIPGSTIGTWSITNTTAIGVRFDLGAGSTINGATPNTWTGVSKCVVAGSTSLIGTNAATLDFAGVQLEPGAVVTPYEYRMAAAEQPMINRYYASSQFSYLGTSTIGATEGGHVMLFSPPRGTPTITRTGETLTNFAAPTIAGTAAGFTWSSVIPATGQFVWSGSYQADAEITI